MRRERQCAVLSGCERVFAAMFCFNDFCRGKSNRKKNVHFDQKDNPIRPVPALRIST